ncbi:MAG: PmoA family protein [Cyclobacteriaceae bacterium]|nr:PmoA family protein [Cyclobacteriaceae bacterium]
MKNTLLICLLLSSFSPVFSQELLAEITVYSGKYNRTDTPVEFVLDQLTISTSDNLLLKEKKTNKSIAFQISQSESLKLSWILEGNLPKKSSRVYNLYRSEVEKTFEKGVDLHDTGDDLQIVKNKKQILSFRYSPQSPPKGVDSVFTRSGFIHPVWAPEGQIISRIQPPDHYHHYGLWNPWTHTEFEGRKVDFWNLGERQGTIQFREFISRESGPVFGGFKALQQHIDLTAPGGKKVAMNEVLGVKVWNTPSPQYNILDINSNLNAASNSPLLIEEYRYAGLGFRATESWTNKNTKILTSEGKDRKTGDATRARWCNIEETTAADSPGILFLSHIQNYSFPEPMRIWPEDANGGRGDVFFQFSPTRERDWEIKPGHSYGLKYRLIVYNGKLSTQRIEELWTDLNYPPSVKINYLNN